MTREEILAMEPGPELEALVAEKVMGWSKQGDFWVGSGLFGPPIIEWCPSTDLSAAWEAVEKFPIVMVERVEVFVGNITVNVTMYPSNETEKSYTVSSRSFPESASKAALLAMIDT